MCIRKAAVWSIPILLAVALSSATAAPEPCLGDELASSGTVPVGVAKIDVTPDYPVRMYGYGSRKTLSEGVAGRLMAKALVIGSDEGDGPAILLTVDNGAVPSPIRTELLARLNAKVPIKSERFMLCNSHNHSGPNIKGMASMPPEHRGPLARYARELTDALECVVTDALASRSPGRLAWTQGKVGFAANRRVLKDGKWAGFGAVPEAPVDHSLPLLRVTDGQGKLLAVVVNYACHCTTLRGNFMQIHGDWAGSAQKFIEADHPGAVAMICIGCGADADPCPHGTVELCDQHGRALADEAQRLLKGPFTPIEPPLVARMESFKVPHVKPPQESSEQPPPQTYSVATWVFGDELAMIFLEGEVVVDYALRLKRELDADRLWITAYTNDVPCYIVSERLIEEGGYEVKASLSWKVSKFEFRTFQTAF